MVKTKESIVYYGAVGRRKSAVARVRLYIASKSKEVAVGDIKMKQGDIFINKKQALQIFPSSADTSYYLRPLVLTDTKERFAISIHVRGGGKRGQLDAISHGLARAIEKIDPSIYRAALKAEGLLTRDPRVRERRKVGTGGKARRRKQSPKR